MLSGRGGIIREGFNETIDSLKKAKTDAGKGGWRSGGGRQRAQGIKRPRIKYNKVFAIILR